MQLDRPALLLFALSVPMLASAQVTPPERRPFPLPVVPAAVPSDTQPKPDSTDRLRPGLFGGLRFRSIGPAAPSGRIGEVAVHPANRSTWYVAVHSGGVWKTVNAGTTWTPVFDA